MKIVAFLQNQWFRDPESVRRMMTENPERRERYIAAFLFMGCLTGKRLRAVFGEELCDQIVWEEVSPEIGGYAASRFPADAQHIATVICKHKPDVILAFGKIAANGVWAIMNHLKCPNEGAFTAHFISGPHPAARGTQVLSDLRIVADQLTKYMDKST